MSIKFFVAVGTAIRTTGRTGNAVTVHPMLLLKETREEAQRALEARLKKVYPPVQGWQYEECVIYELPKTLESEGYRFTWKVERV